MTKLPKIEPFRKGSGTSLLDEASYRKAWKEANESGVTWNQFQKQYDPSEGGIFHTEKGTKLKPQKTRFGHGSVLSDSSDIGQFRRVNRGKVLSYIFGGTPMSSSKAQAQAGKEGFGDVEAHHRFGQAEFSPFVDDIIDDISAKKGSKQYQQGLAKLEAGRSYFLKSPHFAGDVLENYEGFNEFAHRIGGDSMHNQLSNDKITFGQGMSPFQPEGTKYKTGSTGVDGVNTQKYIQSLPWSKEESSSFFDRNPDDFKKKKYRGAKPDSSKISRWSALEDFMTTSGGIRNELADKVRADSFLQRPNSINRSWYNTQKLIKDIGTKVGGKLRATDSAAQLAAGNYVGGTIGLALQSPALQKRLAKLLGKQAAGIAPGVGGTLSAMESLGYAKQGRFTQSGIAALSGVVGEIPGLGDVLSAGLDVVNTGIDIFTGNIAGPNIEDQYKKIDTDTLEMVSKGFRGI